jgi:SAUR family protein
VAPGAVVKPVSALPGATCGKVPAGHVPVVVGAEGEDTQRFVIPAELLGRPPIVELLRRVAPRRSTGTLVGASSASPSPWSRSATVAEPDGGLTLACFAMIV